MNALRLRGRQHTVMQERPVSSGAKTLESIYLHDEKENREQRALWEAFFLWKPVTEVRTEAHFEAAILEEVGDENRQTTANSKTV